MQAAFEDKPASDDREQEIYWSVVSDLVSLIERTRTDSGTTDLADEIEGAKDTPVEAVLDDQACRKITPTDSWSDCNRRLREALYSLLEARPACGHAAGSKASKQVAA
jgi:hypothetical protein